MRNLVILMFASTLSACAGMMLGGGASGQAPAPANRSAAPAAASDSALSQKVQARLAADAMLAQQGIVGTFGPTPIACPLLGTATVSGTIASAGIFSPGDQLSAAYDGCTRAADALDGQLDVTISAFEGVPGGNYRVTSTAAHAALERSANAFVMTGTGSLTAIYDQGYSMGGLIEAASTSASFTVSSGGVSRQLSGTAANVRIELGPTPRTVHRAVSGLLTSPEIQGSYGLTSVIPDTFLADTNPATGPFSGELRVTATDNSSVAIVALDAFNVRLAIDLDGDFVIDEQITTTWLNLQ